MSKHMARDLERLRKSIVQMASAVEGAIYLSTRALFERNLQLASQVINGDHEIDAFENEVSNECLKILALHQPVAVDLRRISVVLLITTDLERMGDLAVGIAERAQVLAKLPSTPIPDLIHGMTQCVTEMVRLSLDSYIHSEVTIARRVIRMDQEVKKDHDAIIAGLIAGMKSIPEHIEAGLSLFSVIRHVKRVADHATNIAEDVIYLVEGSIVRHRWEQLGEE